MSEHSRNRRTLPSPPAVELLLLFHINSQARLLYLAAVLEIQIQARVMGTQKHRRLEFQSPARLLRWVQAQSTGRQASLQTPSDLRLGPHSVNIAGS